MGREARDRRPKVSPIQKVQLNEENTTLRAVLAVVFLAIGVSALVYAVGRLFTSDPGWQAIQVGTAEGPNCGEEFVFLYETGTDGGSAQEESRAVTRLYTDACRKAYQLFNADESFEGMVNLRDINQRPNEVLKVDPVLYQAFEAVQNAGDRTLYLGPIVTRYDDLFSCNDDVQLMDFDPRLSLEVAEEYAADAAYAVDPQQIDLELLGENQVCLRVSEEYLAYAQREIIDRFLDFGWMKNAFIADYLADTMMRSGYTHGTITSMDGFARCMDGREQSYGLGLLAWQDKEEQPVQAGTVEYQGPMSLVTLRTFPAAAGDEFRYYRLRNGEIRTLYLDPKDGVCRSAAESILCYSSECGCAQLAMMVGSVFIADSLQEDSLRKMASEGVQYIWGEGGSFHASDPDVVVTDLYEGYRLETVNYGGEND